MNPENAHHLIAGAGQTLCRTPFLGKFLLKRYIDCNSSLNYKLFNVSFSNPIGIAAGFDKNASYTELLRLIGFGYTEYGSITAISSNGNPKPRLFRIPDDRG
ncbi:quinone-dependent dihydroorotate dehydrogenase, partial [Balneolaceae bacterium ANBcel3]|nr:quinone-dependent dihydroorotate dehydrogenase [Balneolaceae bacterium ANBcel3]